MQLNHERITTPPKASATVVLLRDEPKKGLEVFLLRRHTASTVLGGAFVFPGGKLDEADCVAKVHTYLDTSTSVLQRSLAEPDLADSMAAGLYVAAVREVLEECGVLFASRKDQDTVTDLAQQRHQWQKALNHGQAFVDLLQGMDLRIDAQALVPWSRWITPIQPSVTNRRFDTRFFVAALPFGQHPIHDNIEAIDSVWLSPLTALTQYWAGELPLAPPQIMTLVSLLPYLNTYSVLQTAKARTPPLIFPQTFDDAGVRTLCYPGHPRHSISQRVMPGPTCLRFVAGRFEPVGGFAGFYDADI